MSWKATGFVKELTGLGSSEKLLLMILSDYYNEEDGAAWPSISRLAREMGVSERQVYRLITQLELRRVLTVQHGRGRSSNRYSFAGYPCHNVTPDMDVTSDLTPVSPEQLSKPSTLEEDAARAEKWDRVCQTLEVVSGVDHIGYWKTVREVPPISIALDRMLHALGKYNAGLILTPGSVGRLSVAAEILADLDLNDNSFKATLSDIDIKNPNCLQELAKQAVEWATDIRSSYGKVSFG